MPTLTRRGGELAFVVAFVAVCASIVSFVVLLESSSPGWGVVALNRVSEVLVALSIALALAVERRPAAGAWQAQVAAAAVSVAFAIVALVKLYSASSILAGLNPGLNWAEEASIVGTGALAFGLIGLRATASAAWIGFVAAGCVALGFAVYAVVLQPDAKAFVWYLVAGAAAALAGSAAARMERR
jgi:hypothetical protein